MIFIGILFAVAIMGAMVFLAIDKKSDFRTRVASLIALGVMILTVIICIFVALSSDKVVFDPSTLIVGEPVEVKEDNNLLTIIFSIVFFLVLFIIIAVLAMKEHKKSLAKKGEVIFTVY